MKSTAKDACDLLGDVHCFCDLQARVGKGYRQRLNVQYAQPSRWQDPPCNAAQATSSLRYSTIQVTENEMQHPTCHPWSPDAASRIDLHVCIYEVAYGNHDVYGPAYCHGQRGDAYDFRHLLQGHAWYAYGREDVACV